MKFWLGSCLPNIFTFTPIKKVSFKHKTKKKTFFGTNVNALYTYLLLFFFLSLFFFLKGNHRSAFFISNILLRRIVLNSIQIVVFIFIYKRFYQQFYNVWQIINTTNTWLNVFRHLWRLNDLLFHYNKRPSVRKKNKQKKAETDKCYFDETPSISE